MSKQALSFTEHFEKVTDPRKKENAIEHKLMDLLTIAICATISGADGWEDIALYGKQKETWLKQFLELPNGIPSHDTFRRVFSLINPDEFRVSFMDWVREVVHMTKGSIIAIDGKTSRRSHNDGEHPLHLVSAWAQEQRGVRTIKNRREIQ